MPFEGEAPSYKAIRRLASNPKVQEILEAIRVPDNHNLLNPEGLKSKVRASDFLPRLVIAIDGSWQDYQPQKGFPGAELAYLTVSTVVLDVTKLVELSGKQAQQPPPTEYRRLENAESVDAVLPGCNVVLKNEPHARASFRRVLFDALSGQAGWEGCESLLQTYEALLTHREQSNPGCPWEECQRAEPKQFKGVGIYKCPCGERDIYSTDSLRIYEGINPSGSSGKAFGEVMQVLERIKLVHILRMMEQRDLLPVLSQIAFVVDGPLAVYGHPAWLSLCIYMELRRINTELRNRGFPDLLIVGIEKTGIFAEHLARLDQDEKGAPNKMARQAVYLLTDEYIKRNVIFSDSREQYGSQTYFGRKFFYKTRAGSLLVGAVPFLDESHRNTRTANVEQFPRLSDALALLDRLETTRYPNALIPLTAAHAEATLPMNIGRKILESLARDLMAAR